MPSDLCYLSWFEVLYKALLQQNFEIILVKFISRVLINTLIIINQTGCLTICLSCGLIFKR